MTLFGQQSPKPKPANAKPREPDAVPPDQRPALAQALLCDALVERLHERLGVTVAAETEVKAALQQLRLSPQEAVEPQAARRLCALLDCQALLVPRVLHITIQDGVTRTAALYATVTIAGLKGKGEREEGKASQAQTLFPFPSSLFPTEGIPTAGVGEAGRMFFRDTYVQTQAAVIRAAAQQAAQRIAHTLKSGQIDPLIRLDTRIALVPVTSPAAADELLFTSQGRQVLPGRLRDLPGDVSTRFIPNLLPMSTESILSPAQVNAALGQSGSASLWVKGGMPDVVRIQDLGRRLGVDYVLLARVTDLELEEGPAEAASPEPAAIGTIQSASPGLQREARAEAVGALVRVVDGVVLWQDRATATMTARPEEKGDPRPPATQRRITLDAIHFALVDLARRFADYRASYMQ